MKGLLSALCFLGATTGLGLDGANDPPAPADLPPPTAAAPAAPTDTERLLLERIEKLEKRLAEIESARGEIAREPAGTTAAPPPSTAVGSPTAASTTVSAPRIASSTPSAATFAGTLPNPLQSAPATPQQATITNEQPPPPAEPEPFAFADFTWLNGNSRETDFPLQGKYFTGEVYADGNFTYSMNHPQDHTLVGSTEVAREGEFQVQQFGIGGDFHMDNVHARLLTQFGVNSTLIPRNDASPGRGQFQLQDAFRYVSEAYGGYHFNIGSGLNVDYGIFMSYIGLFSYYQYENWAYQPSYVSSNTPWFFQGLRTQYYPSDKLKLELWIINGWQSYGVFNNVPGIGTQLTWRPNGNLDIISNNYYLGKDTLGNPGRKRMHTDDSIQVKYYDNPNAFFDMAAFTVTFDAGCEYGGGVKCSGGDGHTPSQYFLGFMLYNRVWFANKLMAFTVGGGYIDNPGRYLVLLPPINGATAISGTPYFTENPGDQFKAWDWSFTLDYMPSQWGTIRAEFNRRYANVPYFAGAGGVTPPGGNQGLPGSIVPGFTPDLVKSESRFTLGLLVRI
ncbi:MAG TPA: outer membrane beta-barrel protein [Thermoanaerobaculia bacterium]|nr:outer membrane beta-barrel protein [Thermoanaerobaculia bacterium]